MTVRVRSLPNNPRATVMTAPPRMSPKLLFLKLEDGTCFYAHKDDVEGDVEVSRP